MIVPGKRVLALEFEAMKHVLDVRKKLESTKRTERRRRQKWRESKQATDDNISKVGGIHNYFDLIHKVRRYMTAQSPTHPDSGWSA